MNPKMKTRRRKLVRLLAAKESKLMNPEMKTTMTSLSLARISANLLILPMKMRFVTAIFKES